MTHRLAPTRIAGLDGCRAGWVVATISGCAVVADLTEPLQNLDLLGVDMPVGLPATGRRACDVEARSFLSPRGSTVFPTPHRDVVHHLHYDAANEASRRLHGVGLSRQTFALFPKIREVDAAAQRFPHRLVEVHPECAFARMAGSVLPAKKSAEGRAQRRRLIHDRFGSVPDRLPGAGADDILDAYAVLWSTLRFAAGDAETFGGDPDTCGLPMRIVS